MPRGQPSQNKNKKINWLSSFVCSDRNKNLNFQNTTTEDVEKCCKHAFLYPRVLFCPIDVARKSDGDTKANKSIKRNSEKLKRHKKLSELNLGEIIFTDRLTSTWVYKQQNCADSIFEKGN